MGKRHLLFTKRCGIIIFAKWLGVAQLVARYLGVVEVACSNQVTPTNISKRLSALCGEPFFYLSKHFNTKKLRRNIGAFDFVLHLRKLCKFCFQCRIDLSVKLVVFFVFRYSLCLRLLYLVGLYYGCTSLRY